VIGGKSDEQNELALRNFVKPEFTVMHTSKPGSGFMIIRSDNPSKEDLEEAAIFCACFSQQWKKAKSDKESVEIDVFKGSQIYKNKTMKLGTFGIMGMKDTMKVKLKLVLIFQKGKLRAVPKNGKEKILVEIKPGKLSKEEAIDKIAKKIRNEFHFPVSKDEIMSAIPSDRLSVK